MAGRGREQDDERHAPPERATDAGRAEPDPGADAEDDAGGGLDPEERERRRRQGLEARDGEGPRRRPPPHAGQRHRHA